MSACELSDTAQDGLVAHDSRVRKSFRKWKTNRLVQPPTESARESPLRGRVYHNLAMSKFGEEFHHIELVEEGFLVIATRTAEWRNFRTKCFAYMYDAEKRNHRQPYLKLIFNWTYRFP